MRLTPWRKHYSFACLNIFVEHDVRDVLVECCVPNPSHELPAHDCLCVRTDTGIIAQLFFICSPRACGSVRRWRTMGATHIPRKAKHRLRRKQSSNGVSRTTIKYQADRQHVWYPGSDIHLKTFINEWYKLRNILLFIVDPHHVFIDYDIPRILEHDGHPDEGTG